MYSVDLYAGVWRASHINRMSKREAARVFGIDRKTVGKMLAHSVPPGSHSVGLASHSARVEDPPQPLVGDPDDPGRDQHRHLSRQGHRSQIFQTRMGVCHRLSRHAYEL